MSPADLLGHLRAAQQGLLTVQQELTAAQRVAATLAEPTVLRIPLGLPLWDAQREIVRQTIKAQGGNRSRAAKVLGIARRTIANWLPAPRSGGDEPVDEAPDSSSDQDQK